MGRIRIMPLDRKSSKTLACESESIYETGHARKASGTNHLEGGPGANLALLAKIHPHRPMV